MSAPKNDADWPVATRRTFISQTFAAGLGLGGFVAANVGGNSSSLPRDVLHGIEHNCHPFAPQRVVVMTNSGGGRCQNRERLVDAAICTCLREQFQFPTEKHDVIVRLMRVMTDYYRVPHLFGTWATRLTKREALAATGFGRGFGFFHQFQDNESLQTANPPVDWWLALFPEGTDWESFDGEPVFGLIGHVFHSDHIHFPGRTCMTYCLTEQIGRMIAIDPINNWARIARLDKAIAARAVNQIISDHYHSELDAAMRYADSKAAGRLITARSGLQAGVPKATDDYSEDQ